MVAARQAKRLNISAALNSFKLLPLLQLDVGMKPFVQSGVFTETSQNELVAAAARRRIMRCPAACASRAGARLHRVPV